MKGYILRWNPNISSWTYDRHRELMKDFENEERVGMNWSIYDFEDLEEGDFYILQQVGTENDGIAMTGTFCSEPYTEASWKKKDGTNLFYADMDVDFMIYRRGKDGKDLAATDLEKQFPEIEWHKGHSGVLIPEEKLEPLVLEICQKFFKLGYEYHFCKKLNNKYEAFHSLETLLQTACDYINQFCPKMRERIIKEAADRIVYKNFSKGDMIDTDLLEITFDIEKMDEQAVISRNYPAFLKPIA